QIEPVLPFIAWPLGSDGEDLLAQDRESQRLKQALEDAREELKRQEIKLQMMRELLATPAQKKRRQA
ncbi:MAG: hypothetical protein IKX79_05855, partial [Desulfovibrionaceae bacterium]|nr:hypothetical protein [Desulfovibrionaceae bacterium]